MSEHKLRRGSDIAYIVEGDEGFRAYQGVCLGHDGDFTAVKIKVSAGENYADGLVANGTNYYHDVPHGDVSQGATWVWLDEIPAGFYIG
jgi:hypothetical protein